MKDTKSRKYSGPINLKVCDDYLKYLIVIQKVLKSVKNSNYIIYSSIKIISQ